MSSISQNVPDVSTFAANVVVFLGAIAAAVVGAAHATKKIKEAWLDALKPGEIEVTKTQVIGGILQDQYGSAMLADALKSATHEAEHNNQLLKEAINEMRELRHTLDRMMDRIDRHGR